MADSVAHLHPVDAPNSSASGGRRAYSDAFKRDAVEAARAAKSISQAARSLGVSRPTLRAWMTESPPPPMSMVEAVRSGNRRTYLVRARDDLAAAIDAGMPARERLQSLRMLDGYVQQLEELEALEKEEASGAASTPDELLDPDDL